MLFDIYITYVAAALALVLMNISISYYQKIIMYQELEQTFYKLYIPGWVGTNLPYSGWQVWGPVTFGD